MHICEKAIDILNNTQDKNYIYVSNSFENLGRVEHACKDSCDVVNASSRFVLTYPRTMGLFYAQLDGVFYDEEATTPEDIKAYLFLQPDAEFIKVNTTTQEIISD